jgi:hypothetical protein
VKQHPRSVAGFALVAVGVFGAILHGRVADGPAVALGLLLCAGLGWILALCAARRSPPPLRAIVAGAVLLRLLALGSDLQLSDDAYRSVWEGEVVLHGASPYAHGPDDPTLAGLRAELPRLHARVAHREVSAVYPPIVQAAGAFAALVARLLHASPEVWGVRVLRFVFGCADLLVLLPLARLLQGSGRTHAGLVAWAWCPLVVLESGGSAHGDALGILLLLLALTSLARADESTGAAADARPMGWLASAILVKYLPLVVVPWIGRSPAPQSRDAAPQSNEQSNEPVPKASAVDWAPHAGSMRANAVPARLAWLLVFLALGFAQLLFLSGGLHGVGAGLYEYGSRWQSGSLVFRFVEGLCLRLFEPTDGWDDPHRVARLVAAALWIAWAAWVVRHVRERVRGVGLLIAGYLVLTPALHPWYLMWIVPFLAIELSPAWVWLVAAAPVLYAPLRTWQSEGRWTEPAWMWPIVAMPFFALLVAGMRARRTAA